MAQLVPVWLRPNVISLRRFSAATRWWSQWSFFDGAAVAQSAVAAGEPGDGSFDHGPVPVVFGAPVGVAGGMAGSTLEGVVGPDE
ncbi:hypothetical protein AN480_29420 [Mycobacterium intracellulare subsp. chimaera]|nr:hypothetical protein AN480_29420 [Mycobacterium intracellulare subsp. chimaera]